MDDITVLLLAGGDSTRFFPLSDKNWLHITGKPVIFHTVSQIVQFGIRNIVIVGNNKNIGNIQKLKNEFSRINLYFVEQTDSRGMGGAVLSARKYIQGKKILIINPADFYEDILLSQLQDILSQKDEAVIAGIASDAYFPGGYLSINKGYITGIVEKPNPSELPSKMISLVFDYFRRADDFLESIDKVTFSKDDLFEKAIDNLIKQNKKIRFLHYKGYWGHLKFPWECLEVSSYFLGKLKRRIDKRAIIDKSASIIGNVVIGPNVRVLENVKIVGPAFIGEGTIVGNNVVIRQSNIESNCVIGYSTEITRSVIGSNCWFHSNYIGDSIIENNVGMGAGTILANFKLDESTVTSAFEKKKIDTHLLKLGAMIGSNVRIGVNCSIMPGVKIGTNCIVGAGILLSSDVENNMYCRNQIVTYDLIKNKSQIDHSSRKTQRKLLKIP